MKGFYIKREGSGCLLQRAKEVVLKKTKYFMTEYLPKVWEEAKVLEISKDELMDMIQKLRRGNEG